MTSGDVNMPYMTSY